MVFFSFLFCPNSTIFVFLVSFLTPEHLCRHHIFAFWPFSNCRDYPEHTGTKSVTIVMFPQPFPSLTVQAALCCAHGFPSRHPPQHCPLFYFTWELFAVCRAGGHPLLPSEAGGILSWLMSELSMDPAPSRSPDHINHGSCWFWNFLHPWLLQDSP